MKKSGVLILSIIFAILALTAGGYWWWGNKAKVSETADLKKYSNKLLGMEFSYPKNFIPYLIDSEHIGDQPSRFTSGQDSYAPMYDNSYFVIDAGGNRGVFDCASIDNPKTGYSGSYDAIQKFIKEGKPIKFENCKEIILSIDQIAQNSAYHKTRPFGENPIISKLEIEGNDARTITASDPKYNEAEFIIRLKKPISIEGKIWDFIIIHAGGFSIGGSSKEIIRIISNSLHFSN